MDYWLNILLLVGAAYAVLYILADAIVFIEAVNYGVVWRFGGQTKGTRKEGLNFKIPIIDEIKIVSLQLQTKIIKVEFTTKDNLRLTIPGSLQHRADPKVCSTKDGKNVFVRTSDEAITTGVEKDVQAKLGGIGGKYNGEDFIQNRQALDSIINSILRLDVPLHLSHDIAACGQGGCCFCRNQENRQVEADQLIDFYNAHWRQIKALLDDEENHVENRSGIEKRYGIDIVKYSLSEVDFTKETQAAQEEQKQADYRTEAGKKVIGLAEKVKKSLPNISDQQVLNWADSILNPDTPRTMISVEGDSGVLGGLLGLLSKKIKGGGK